MVGKKKELEKETHKEQAEKNVKFVFNTKGRITEKESKELSRTQRNIMDWVKQEKSKIREKVTFEEKEQAEVELEQPEVRSTDKEVRMGRIRRKMAAWEAHRICQQLVQELGEGVERI